MEQCPKQLQESYAQQPLTAAADECLHGSEALSKPGQSIDDPPVQETLAQTRRRQRLALIEEFGGDGANLKQVALAAMKRGMYSRTTNRGDVELCLLRTWK